MNMLIFAHDCKLTRKCTNLTQSSCTVHICLHPDGGFSGSASAALLNTQEKTLGSLTPPAFTKDGNNQTEQVWGPAFIKASSHNVTIATSHKAGVQFAGEEITT